MCNIYDLFCNCGEKYGEMMKDLHVYLSCRDNLCGSIEERFEIRRKKK